MSAFQLLLVEDNEKEINVCKDALETYQKVKQREVNLIECKNLKEALSKLDSSIDGAIIDLKLQGKAHEGNKVLIENEKLHLRIPVAILTGTPDEANVNCANIGVFKKGDPGTGYADLLERLWNIYETGLTRIMGGRGTIEDTLNEVFRNSLLPRIDEWMKYSEADPSRTEKSLLRHTLNHLLQLLDDEHPYYPEEVYLHRQPTTETWTGSLVKKKEEDKWFVVMNPACDLVRRENGRPKTDRILIIEVDSIKATSRKERKEMSKNKELHYHLLPETDFFKGGLLNFRKLTTLEIGEFEEKFEVSQIQISPSFVKDIASRFSSYYARQGQPDIDFDKFIDP